MAPALHVSHLLVVTLTDTAPSLRIVRMPSGPTLSLRIERYSLAKDIRSISRHAKSTGLEYLSPPLLVLASFPQPGPQTPPHLTLLQKSFQSMFPALSPQLLTLSSARRVVLISYDAERDTVQVRHYLISVRPYGVSRRVRRVLEGTSASGRPVLDLGNERDVADFLLRKPGETDPNGYESASSAASDIGEAISLADDYVGRNNRKGSKKAVKLDEIGPRLELRLVKITEGTPGKEGEVLYHKFGALCVFELCSTSLTDSLQSKRPRRRSQRSGSRTRKRKSCASSGEKSRRPMSLARRQRQTARKRARRSASTTEQKRRRTRMAKREKKVQRTTRNTGMKMRRLARKSIARPSRAMKRRPKQQDQHDQDRINAQK